jgi:ubiquinone/menaquinone biosynthesis C-methylase UbiE
MVEPQIRYEDGAAYERYMGTWSRLAGEIFLDWLAPREGLRWIDIGCGSGAFTELIVERCAPAEVQGIDPSEAQLAFARTRPAARLAAFRQGDATAIPFEDARFEAAAMALVIFFIPDPAKGVAEMVRVVSSRGTVATYAWDMLGGGFPLEPIREEMRKMGFSPPLPPSANASRIDALRVLWASAGLDAVETREISVERTYAAFDDYWMPSLFAASVRPVIATMTSDDVALLKSRVEARLPVDPTGRIRCSARANAIKGCVP